MENLDDMDIDGLTNAEDFLDDEYIIELGGDPKKISKSSLQM